MTAYETIRGTVKFDGERYDWTAELCEDKESYAVNVDFGNGFPENIGFHYFFTAQELNQKDIVEMVMDELRFLSEC
jgi:hypothetical protein